MTDGVLEGSWQAGGGGGAWLRTVPIMGCCGLEAVLAGGCNVGLVGRQAEQGGQGLWLNVCYSREAKPP